MRIRMKRRVARVGTPDISIRMQFALFQNLWLFRRWNIPPVSIARTNLALVSNRRCSTEWGIEYEPEPKFVQSMRMSLPVSGSRSMTVSWPMPAPERY